MSKVAVALATSLMVMPLAAGCARSDAREAEVMLADAARAMRELDTVRMTQTVTGDKYDLSYDIRVDQKRDCVGTMTAYGDEADFRVVDDVMFVKGDRSFWRRGMFAEHSADSAAVLAPHWAIIPEAVDPPTICDYEEQLANLDGPRDMGEHADVRLGDRKTVAGREAVEVKGADEHGNHISYWVATGADPYLLRVTFTADGDRVEFAFADFNEDVLIRAPHPVTVMPVDMERVDSESPGDSESTH